VSLQVAGTRQGPPIAEEDTDARRVLQLVIYGVPRLSCHLPKPSLSHEALTCLTENTDNIQRRENAHACLVNIGASTHVAQS
jgi:hypothetical protein